MIRGFLSINYFSCIRIYDRFLSEIKKKPNKKKDKTYESYAFIPQLYASLNASDGFDNFSSYTSAVIKNNMRKKLGLSSHLFVYSKSDFYKYIEIFDFIIDHKKYKLEMLIEKSIDMATYIISKKSKSFVMKGKSASFVLFCFRPIIHHVKMHKDINNPIKNKDYINLNRSINNAYFNMIQDFKSYFDRMKSNIIDLFYYEELKPLIKENHIYKKIEQNFSECIESLERNKDIHDKISIALDLNFKEEHNKLFYDIENHLFWQVYHKNTDVELNYLEEEFEFFWIFETKDIMIRCAVMNVCPRMNIRSYFANCKNLYIINAYDKIKNVILYNSAFVYEKEPYFEDRKHFFTYLEKM